MWWHELSPIERKKQQNDIKLYKVVWYPFQIVSEYDRKKFVDGCFIYLIASLSDTLPETIDIREL